MSTHAEEFKNLMSDLLLADPITMKGRGALTSLGLHITEEEYLKKIYVDPFTIYERNLNETFDSGIDPDYRYGYVKQVELNVLRGVKNSFENRLKKIEDSLFVIKGGAGSGKTTYVHHLQQECSQIKFCFCDFEEASKGMVLFTAVDKYDPDTSGPFGSYASLWMLQNVSREQKTQRPDVHYPVHKKEQYYTMYPILRDRGCTSCEKIWTCKKVRDIIQKHLNCTNEQAEDVILQMKPFDSLDAMLDDVFRDEDDVFEKHKNEFEILLLERLADPHDMQAELERKNMQETVNSILKTLTDREQKVIRARFGFDNDEEKTLEEVGADFGVTRERVRQIEAKALRKLSHPSRLCKLKGYI